MTTFVTQSRILWSSTPSNNTDQFREFINAMTYLFSASGWINTNAVGSIDSVTVGPPGGLGVISGYQVWAFNDQLHYSGYPVYVKVEYGSGDSTGRNTLYVSIGFQHNGSGSIATGDVIGVGSTQRIVISNVGGAGSTATYTHRMCCISGSDLVTIIADDYANAGCPLVVERTKDVNGNATTEGVFIIGYNQTAGQYRESFLWYGPNSASQTPPLETAPTYILAARSGVYQNNLTVGFLLPMLSSSFGYPSRMLGYINGNTLANGVTHLIPTYGTSSLYYVSPNTFANTIGVRGRNASEGGTFRYIIRYE